MPASFDAIATRLYLAFGVLLKGSQMNITALSKFTAACLLATSGVVHAGCSPMLSAQVASAAHIVDSLRPDKPGQARVTAADGSEYSAAQSLWMKGQLRLVKRACEQGDAEAATAALWPITDLLAAHRARG